MTGQAALSGFSCKRRKQLQCLVVVSVVVWLGFVIVVQFRLMRTTFFSDITVPVDFVKSGGSSSSSNNNNNDSNINVQSLVFIHVPKCGGSTVVDRLDHGCQQYWPGIEQLQRGTEIQLDKEYGIHTFHGVTNTLRPRELGLELSGEKWLRIRKLSGHIAHGACQFMAPPCYYVTVLREPRERLISEVRWIQKVIPATANITISEFIEGVMQPHSPVQRYCVLLDNHETRLISGESFPSMFFDTGTSTPCGNLTDRHSDRAIQHLRHPSMLQAGRLERLDLFFGHLQIKLSQGNHWVDFAYSGQVKNANERNSSADVLSPEAEELIELFTRHDRRLYQMVIDYWEAGKRNHSGQ